MSHTNLHKFIPPRLISSTYTNQNNQSVYCDYNNNTSSSTVNTIGNTSNNDNTKYTSFTFKRKFVAPTLNRSQLTNENTKENQENNEGSNYQYNELSSREF